MSKIVENESLENENNNSFQNIKKFRTKNIICGQLKK